MKRKAIFPGTFDPFTIGHASLVERSLRIVDELIIAIGINENKTSYFSLDKRINMIKSLYAHDKRVQVMAYDSLTVSFAEEIKADFIIRGIRTINDFEYEKTIADVNRSISEPSIETILLFTEPELTHISSTIVRELLKFGKDVSKFLPKGLVL